MAIVPVFCDSCGSVWGAPNLIAGSGGHIQMTGSKAGPCPVCGGMGTIPDGVYDLIDDTLAVAESEQIRPDTLQSVIKLLEAAARGEMTPEEALEKTEAEAPALASVIGDYLKQKAPAASWLSLIVAILSALLAPQPPTAEDIAKELRRKPIPVRVGPAHESGGATRRAKTKTKRRAKTYGKAKKRRSRKRR